MDDLTYVRRAWALEIGPGLIDEAEALLAEK